jgi:hypothetical protein
LRLAIKKLNIKQLKKIRVIVSSIFNTTNLHQRKNSTPDIKQASIYQFKNGAI